MPPAEMGKTPLLFRRHVFKVHKGNKEVGSHLNTCKDMATFVAYDFVQIKCQFKNITSNKKELKEIIAAICALLNSNGGRMVLVNDNEGIAGKCSYKVRNVIRTMEQTMRSIIGIELTVSNLHFKEEKGSIFILVKKADSVITIDSNLYLPCQTEVALIPGLAIHSLANIINRKQLPQAVKSGQKIFVVKNKDCGFHESSTSQFKLVKSVASNRTTLGDRIIGKGNKFSCYVSGFANHDGGNIYYGINDDGVVKGQFIPSDDDKKDVIKKVEKAINKMMWPKQIGQPKRGVHWEIFFERVVDENSNPIPSTFVIVIYVAPCLGGVFTEEPECYEIVAGKVEKMSFDTWKKRILQPIWLWCEEEIPKSVGRTKWSSIRNRNTFTFVDKELMNLVANGNWIAIFKKGQILVNKLAQSPDIKLYVLCKYITARYRRGHFIEAQALLLKYTDILPQGQDPLIFEVLQLYLNAALKRASGDLVGLKEFLFAALSKAQLIEPGLVSAIIYIFAATLPDVIKSKEPTMTTSEQLALKALQHWNCVTSCYNDNVLPDMKHKCYLTLAALYLSFNINGQRMKDNEEVRLNEAKKSIMAVHESIYEGHPLSKYLEVELNLVQSMYYYRYSQGAGDQRARYLRDAFQYAEKAESLARYYKFTEQVEWGKTLKALCTEELLRARLSGVVIK